MANKTRRRRAGQSGDPKEVEVRTGAAPAPGEVVSRKQRDLIGDNRARAKMKAAAALEALSAEDYREAGRLFHDAAQAANLANAHRLSAKGNAFLK